MRKKLTIVYHESESKELIEKHRENLSRALGISVETITIRELLELRKRASRECYLFAYMLFRGGHYVEVVKRAQALGYRVLGKIPISLIAKAISKHIVSSRCKRALIAYVGSKRYNKLRELDLNKLKRLVEQNTGCSVSLKPLTFLQNHHASMEEGECIVVATLLPSRLLGRIKSSKTNVIMPFVLSSVEKELIGHISHVLKLQYNSSSTLTSQNTYLE